MIAPKQAKIYLESFNLHLSAVQVNLAKVDLMNKKFIIETNQPI